MEHDTRAPLILLVDDAPENLWVLEQILKDNGYRVNMCKSGQETLDSLKTSLPDLILLDVTMPGMNGYELCRILKENPAHSSIPIIFVSAASNTSDKVSAFTAGGVDYITKPINLEEVLARVNTHIELSLLQKQLLSRTEQLENTIKDLKASNEALETFSYSVSHDLKGPLAGVSGFIAILQENHSQNLNEKGQNYLNRVQRSAQRMTEIVNDLLTLAKTSTGFLSPKPIDLTQICEDIISEMHANSPDISTQSSIEPDLKTRADPSLVKILMQNLLDNAWKYSANNSKAQIQVGQLNQDDAKTRGYPNRDVFFIRDNGIGFDMKNVKQIFEPMTRLHSKDEFEGTGIGLATSLRIIIRHKGDIWAESEENKGNTFYFTLTP